MGASLASARADFIFASLLRVFELTWHGQSQPISTPIQALCIEFLHKLLTITRIPAFLFYFLQNIDASTEHVYLLKESYLGDYH